MKRILIILFAAINILNLPNAALAVAPNFTFGTNTVYDSTNNLTWTRDAYTPGPAACSPGIYNWWSTATGTYINCLNSNNYLGYSDWRVPTIDELRIFSDNALHYNDLNALGFTNVQATYYWSSSTDSGNASYAWLVSMLDGYVGASPKPNGGHVWPVRTGQSGASSTPVDLVLDGTAMNYTANSSDSVHVAITSQNTANYNATASFGNKNLFGIVAATGTRVTCPIGYDNSSLCLSFNGTLQLGNDGSGFPSGTTTGFHFTLRLLGSTATGDYTIDSIATYFPRTQLGAFNLSVTSTALTGITITPSTVNVGSTSTIRATPSGASLGTCTSSNSSIASVNGTSISGITAGMATITCSGQSSQISVTMSNATCGSANATTVTTAPSANLCTSGTASTVTGTGPWSWSCNVTNGGTSANCLANITASQTATIPVTGVVRLRPQVIMGGFDPILIDMIDDSFKLYAVVRPGATPIQTVQTAGNGGGFSMAMNYAGTYSNGDQRYERAFVFPRGAFPDNTLLGDLFGSSGSQFRMSVVDTAQQTHSFPDLEFGNQPPVTQAVTSPSTATSSTQGIRRASAQVLAAGFDPQLIDLGDDAFNVVAIVRQGVTSINRVSLTRNQGGFAIAMIQDATLPNGDIRFKATYTYPRGAFPAMRASDLFGTQPGQFNITVTDRAQFTHSFPGLQWGNMPAQ